MRFLTHKLDGYAALRARVDAATEDPRSFIELLQRWLPMTQHLQRSGETMIALGAWSLAPGFSIGRIDAATRAKFPADGPRVCTEARFLDLTKPDRFEVAYHPISLPARASIPCRSCGMKFDIRELADVVGWGSDHMIDISNRSGQELTRVLDTKRKDKRRYWQNDRTGCALEVCRVATEGDAPYVRCQVGTHYVVQPGDHLSYTMWEYWHPQCWISHLESRTRNEFYNLLQRAGFDNFIMSVTRNMYGSESWRGPWFSIDLGEKGSFTIGWRKRVIQIDYAKTEFRGSLTGGDDVTSGATYCHAWDRDKTVEYLVKLREGLSEVPVTC